MKNRILGRTGLSVSEIGHGLWGMAGWTGTNDDEARQALELSVSLGCTFFDSAWAYGDGASDRILGDLINSHTSFKLVSATKIPPAGYEFPANPNKAFSDVFPLDHVLEFGRKSLKAAGIEIFDLMQLHVWDDAWADDPNFHRVAEAIKANGVARFFGISLNRWEPWNGLKAIKTGLVDTVQVIYNVFDQAPEDELFPLCAEKNIGVIARVPLDEGSLGGKLTINTKFPEHDWRSKYFGPENLPQTIDHVSALQRDLPNDIPLPEAALRHILGNPVVSTVIVGMRRIEHVKQNLCASDLGSLDPTLMAKLRKHRWDREVTHWAN